MFVARGSMSYSPARPFVPGPAWPSTSHVSVPHACSRARRSYLLRCEAVLPGSHSIPLYTAPGWHSQYFQRDPPTYQGPVYWYHTLQRSKRR